MNNWKLKKKKSIREKRIMKHYLWEATSSDQSCHPEESAPRFLKLKCACSLHVAPPEQGCLGLGSGVVYGLPQDIRRLSLGTVTRKLTYHQCPSTPQQVRHSLGPLFPRLLHFFCEFQAKEYQMWNRCWDVVNQNTVMGSKKRSLKSIWRMPDVSKDWQQKTRTGNATMREFVPVLVNSWHIQERAEGAEGTVSSIKSSFDCYPFWMTVTFLQSICILIITKTIALKMAILWNTL